MAVYDITVIGELLIDFTPVNCNGETAFLPKPGGAPANVAVAVNHLGGRSAFLGKVGSDKFGQFLKGVLESEKVDTSGLIMDAVAPTTLAFVHLDENGDRDFSFYRKNCADTQLSIEDLNLPVIRQSKILHFGSVSLTDSPAKEAVLYAARYAREQGILVSFDPNYRPALWDSKGLAVASICEGLRLADIVKVSAEEMELITGETDCELGTKALAAYGAKLVVVTLGPDGAFFRFGNDTAHIPTLDIKVKDTNGAGDAFFGGLLTRLTRDENPLEKSAEDISDAIRFANAVGALTTTKHGAIPAIPLLDEVERVL